MMLPKNNKRVKILNVEVDSFDFMEALQCVKEGIIVTPNVDHLILTQKDKKFYSIYKEADFVFCDSKIIQLLSLFLKRPIKEQITGSDFFPAFCKYHGHRENDINIFLLGGMTPKILEKAKQNINKYSNNIVVDGYSPPFGFEKDTEECKKIISLVNQSNANVLAVGVGAPKQEKFIHDFRHCFRSINLFFAIGATIDFESGVLLRAPKWMTNIGLEWFFRMVIDPQRLIKRYLIDDLPFFFLFVKQLLGLYRDPFDETQ